MNDWFEWNGVKCTTYGIHVSEHPPLTIPKERVTHVTVPGRPGTVTITEGADVYEDMALTVKCWMPDPSVFPAVAAWLKGRGTLTFANRQGGYYYARLSEEAPFNRIMRGNAHVSFELTFLCSPPFWYADDVDDETYTPDQQTGIIGAILEGEGTVYSEPLLALTGYGSIDLSINDVTVRLDGLDGTIYLDCAAGIAYMLDGGEKVFAGSLVTLDDSQWPTLRGNEYYNQVGATPVTAEDDDSYVTSLVVSPRWRYL